MHDVDDSCDASLGAHYQHHDNRTDTIEPPLYTSIEVSTDDDDDDENDNKALSDTTQNEYNYLTTLAGMAIDTAVEETYTSDVISEVLPSWMVWLKLLSRLERVDPLLQLNLYITICYQNILANDNRVEPNPMLYALLAAMLTTR
jgi:hypothetical protein